MAARAERSAEDVRRESEQEREGLAAAVEHLRDELSEATDVAAKLRAQLPGVAAGALAGGFVLAGGIGATMRYFARRGRERRVTARVGRWSILDRN